MFIIGHRGAAGIAPENSLKAIEVAKKNNVDAIECDIQTTSDGRLVLWHDESMLRLAEDPRQISDLTFKQVRALKTIYKQKIPTLEEALEKAGNTPLVIEGKGRDWAEPLAKIIKSHKGARPKVISTNHGELLNLSSLVKSVETYAIDDLHPIEVMGVARSLGFSGISTGAWQYNPFVYFHAKRLGLKLITSPINNKITLRVFNILYPKAQITTDFPDRFKDHKPNKTKKK